MNSIVIFSTANLYYGNSAAVARMNNYERALSLANVDVFLLSTDSLDTNREWMEVEPHIHTLPNENLKIGKFYNPFYVLGLVRKAKKLIKTIKGEVVLLNYPSTKSLLLDLMLLLFCSRYPMFCEVNEAKILHTPTVSTDFPTIFEFIENGKTGLISGIDNISSTIMHFFTDDATRSRIIENINLFDFDNCELIDSIKSIL